MQVSSANDVKIYNLSAGRSLPEWVSDRQRKKLERQNIDIRRRIQLIQDFCMPDISSAVCVTNDGQHVFATGAYKPYVKCFDLKDLSLKFARGLDAEAHRICMLGDDYSKFVLLEDDRWVELHAAYGRHFRLRIPRPGRDIAFSTESSELYFVGSTNNIFRLNLELGQFFESLQMPDGVQGNCCRFSDHHGLFICGTSAGTVEAWDPRDRSKAAVLSLSSPGNNSVQVSSVEYKDAMHIGVGTSTGTISLFDIRSSRPTLTKDHHTGLPIKRISFVPDEGLILSMDSRVLKMWQEEDGRPIAAIEPDHALNDFVRYPNSGLLLMANESPRMLQYFVPALGTAPRFCAYLETLTEELEETEQPAVYDDYKFVTTKQLDEVGLSHLIGTNSLRAYMHGYFIDIRLWSKAQSAARPFSLDKYKTKLVAEKLENERTQRLHDMADEEKLPAVNKELARKLRTETEPAESRKSSQKKKASTAEQLLTDNRFASLFKNPDFEVDESSAQYALVHPRLSKLKEKERKTKKDSTPDTDRSTDVTASKAPAQTPDSDSDSGSDAEEDAESGSSTDSESDGEFPDDHNEPPSALQKSGDKNLSDASGPAKKLTREEIGRQKAIQAKRERQKARIEEEEQEKLLRKTNRHTKFKLHAVSSGDVKSLLDGSSLQNAEAHTLPMAARRTDAPSKTQNAEENSFGGRSLSFVPDKKPARVIEMDAKDRHREERAAVRRPARSVMRQLDKTNLEKKLFSKRPRRSN